MFKEFYGIIIILYDMAGSRGLLIEEKGSTVVIWLTGGTQCKW